MKAHKNTWGTVSQVLKLGYERYVAVHACWAMGNRLRMLVDTQASLLDLTAHAQRLFPPKCRSRWQGHHLVMSMMSFLCTSGVDIKVSAHGTWGSFGSFFSLLIWFLWLIPWLVHLGSHRPSHSANLVPLKEWNNNQTGKCSLFVQLYVLKVILGTLSWCALVVCMLVG